MVKLKDNNNSFTLFDEYFPSLIIKENKNIENNDSVRIKQKKKNEKINKKENKEDDKYQKKMTDYLNIK